jgi:ABC-type nitrate/sulfonate/bicarbonate transport system ATPase subunit
MADNPPIVELKGTSKRFPDPHHGRPLAVLESVSLVIENEEAGEFVALLGPSGCGKSTILNLISGLLAPDEGEVRVFGEPVRGPSPKSVTVPQAYTCFPWLKVLGNVEFGLALQGMPKAERRPAAIQYLEKVGLGDRLNAYPKELSGGMQQRVAIARTLAVKPPIVLMDEPFGALDAQTRSEMQQMLLQLWAEEKNLIVFVTHDITEALLLADRVLVFSPRPAQIIHDLRVPFPRPRPAALLHDPQFINLSEALLQLLKKTATAGQVRVSV